MTTNKDQQNTCTIFGMPILHEGYLTKRGAEWHTWRRRWFVLTNTALFYFRHKTASVPIGQIELQGLVVDTTPQKGLFGFRVKYLFMITAKKSTTGEKLYHNRTFYLIANDQTKVQEWIKAIVAAVNALQQNVSPKVEDNNQEKTWVRLPANNQNVDSNTNTTTTNNNNNNSNLSTSNITSTLNTPVTFAPLERRSEAKPPIITVLVLGATGIIGKHVVDKLLDKRFVNVRAAVKDPVANVTDLLLFGAQLVEFDPSRPDTMERALAGVDKVFMVNKISPNMVAEAKTILSAIQMTNTIKHIVKLSFFGMEDAPELLEAQYHLAIENEIQKLGIDWTFLRPNSFQQNIASFFGPSIRLGRGIVGPFGNSKVSYVNAEDVAAVAAEVLVSDRYKKRIINITGPESLDHHKIAEIISSLTGQQVKYQDIPSDKFRKMISKYGISEFFIEMLIELFEKGYKAGKVQALTNEVKYITGEPAISFEQYVKDNIYDFLPSIPRVLVFDAGDNIGKLFVKALLERGLHVTALVRPGQPQSLFERMGARVIAGPFNDENIIQRALDGVDRVFFAHTLHSKTEELKLLLSKAAVSNSVKYILKLGLFGTDELPFLGISKLQIDVDNVIKVIKNKLRTIVRANLFFQHITSFLAKQILNGTETNYMRNATLSAIDLQDVISVIVEMLATRDVTPLHGNIINLHGPQALDYTTLRSLVEAQLRSQGIPIPLVTPSPPKGNTLLSMTPIDNKSLMNMMNASQSEDELLMKYYGYLALAGKGAFPPTHAQVVKEFTKKPAKTFQEYLKENPYKYNKDRAKTRILVTCANGTVGRNIIDAFLTHLYYNQNNNTAQIEISTINATSGSINPSQTPTKFSDDTNTTNSTSSTNPSERSSTRINDQRDTMGIPFSQVEDPFGLTMTSVVSSPRYPLDLTFVKESDFIIRAAVRSQDAAQELTELGCETVLVDIDNPEKLDIALEDVHILVLIAPWSENMFKVFQAWYEAVMRKKNHSLRFIVKIGLMVSETRSTIFHEWNDDAEKLLQTTGIPYCFIKTNLLMTNFLDQRESIKRGKFYDYKGNDVSVSYVDPRDVGDITAFIIQNYTDFLNKSLTLTGPNSLTCSDIAQILTQVLRRPVKYIQLTEQQAAEGMSAAGVPEALIKSFLALNEVLKQGICSPVLPTVQTLLRRPPYNLYQCVTLHKELIMSRF